MTPIELRDEEPPDDTIVVVRGGEMKSEAVVRSATDNHDEFGVYAISVFLTLDLPVERLCQVEDGLARYGKVRLSTAGGFAALASPCYRRSLVRTSMLSCPTSRSQRWIGSSSPSTSRSRTRGAHAHDGGLP